MKLKCFFIISCFIFITSSIYSQHKFSKSLSIGSNIYTSLNKITAGINLMYINKKSIYFYLNGNIGLTGYKQFDDLIYEKTDSFKVGNSNTYTFAYNIPNDYKTPYDENNTIFIPPNSNGQLNNYKAKIIGSFLNFSVGIPINRKKTFYFGPNISYFWNTDKGNYTYTTTYPEIKRITKSINTKFETLGLGMFLAYLYPISKRIIILSQLNFNFYFPMINKNYGISDGKNPLVGTEQDLSISINYKF